MANDKRKGSWSDLKKAWAELVAIVRLVIAEALLDCAFRISPKTKEGERLQLAVAIYVYSIALMIKRPNHG